MKKLNLLVVMSMLYSISFGQTDSTKKADTQNDTIRIGTILIIKKGKSGLDSAAKAAAEAKALKKRNSKVSTNYFVLDLGLSNFDDQTNYGTANPFIANGSATPLNSSDFKLRTGKSVNVNIWLFMQRLNLIKQNVTLKYGLGVELNNYRFKQPVSFKEGGLLPYTNNQQASNAFVFRDSISFSKNKLAADYLTIPLMLNFATNKADSKKGLSASVGVSAGYLYSQRNKQQSNERGKQKNAGDYDMERFKLSYIAELGIGGVRLYGSYSPKSMFKQGLDFRPYNFGFRFSNW